MTALANDLDELGQRASTGSWRNLSLTQVLGDGARYVRGSAVPEPDGPVVDGAITWRWMDLPAAGITATVAAEPLEPGLQPIPGMGGGSYVDGVGAEGSFDVRPAWFSVLRPLPVDLDPPSYRGR